jgi:hypothetical protein
LDFRHLGFGGLVSEDSKEFNCPTPSLFAERAGLLFPQGGSHYPALQRIRATISDFGNVAIAPPKRKRFEKEGALLDRTLAKALGNAEDLL